MTVDISGLNINQLDALSIEIESRKIAVRQQAQKDAYEEVCKVISARGVSFEDLIALHQKSEKRSKAKIPARYSNPEDPTQSWTGRGRKPAWVHDALKSGKTMEDLEIR